MSGSPSRSRSSFTLGGLWAFQLFGVTWSAFVYVAALFSALTFGLHLLLLRRSGIPKAWSLAIATNVQLGAVVSASYWWYNPISAVAVCLLCTAAFLVLSRPESLLDWGLYAFCLFVASLAKPNVAGVTILTSSLAILGCGRTRWRGLLFMLLAAGASLALLAFYRISPFDVVHSYLSASGRGVPTFERFAQDQAPDVVRWSLMLLVFTFLPVVGLFRGRNFSETLRQLASSWQALVLFGAAAAGLLGCFQNGDLKVVDLTMPMTAVALLCLSSSSSSSSADKAGTRRPAPFALTSPLNLQRFSMTLLSATALWFGVTRYRVEIIGPFRFYQNTDVFPIGDRNAFFARLESGEVLRSLLADMTIAIAAATEKQGHQPKIFFGPRLDWGYAAFNLEPPPHLPYSWWAGVDYPTADVGKMVAAFENAKPEYCFFLNVGMKADTIYMPLEMLNVLGREYRLIYPTRYLLVFGRKPGV